MLVLFSAIVLAMASVDLLPPEFSATAFLYPVAPVLVLFSAMVLAMASVDLLPPEFSATAFL